MSNIKINELKPVKTELTELSNQKLNTIYGGGLNVADVGGGAVVGLVIGSNFGMPIAGAIVGAIIGALK